MSPARLRAGADDREVDGNHRQHAGREIEREAAEKHQRDDRDRATALEHATARNAGLGVLDEGEELRGVHVAAVRPDHRELVDGRQ